MTHHLVFLPATPLLLAEVAGSAPGLAPLRAAAAAALATMPANLPVQLVLTGSPAVYPPASGGTLAALGAPEVVEPGATTDLPWPAVVGRRLLAGAGLRAGSVLAVDGSTAADLDDPVRVLVLADGSACRGERAPGGDQPGAVAFDESVAVALRNGDTAALASLDLTAGARVRADGVAAWRSIGAALLRRRVEVTAGPVTVTDPYGVGYLVGSWRSR